MAVILIVLTVSGFAVATRRLTWSGSLAWTAHPLWPHMILRCWHDRKAKTSLCLWLGVVMAYGYADRQLGYANWATPLTGLLQALMVTAFAAAGCFASRLTTPPPADEEQPEWLLVKLPSLHRQRVEQLFNRPQECKICAADWLLVPASTPLPAGTEIIKLPRTYGGVWQKTLARYENQLADSERRYLDSAHARAAKETLLAETTLTLRKLQAAHDELREQHKLLRQKGAAAGDLHAMTTEKLLSHKTAKMTELNLIDKILRARKSSAPAESQTLFASY